MIDRRQFAKGTASALVALRSNSLWGAASAASSPAGVQVAEFHLRDYLNAYDFPEELISYPLSFAAGTVKKDDLRLYLKGNDAPLVTQFTGVQETDGFLRKATLHFRSDLKMGEEKTFLLMQSPETPAPDSHPIAVQNVEDGRVSIQANQLQILVPSGRNRALNLPVSQAPAPLLAIAREEGKWIGAGKLDATSNGPSNMSVQEMDARVVEQGPLFVKYAVSYTFSWNRSYTVELTVQHNESHVLIDEYATSFGPDDNLAFRFSYKQGVDPNGRLLMANGGYSTGGLQQGASGAYDEEADAKGLLPIKLGLYTPNSINLPRAIAFWNDNGENGILFSLYRLPDWKTSRRALWRAYDLPDNLEFYAEPNGGDKFVRAAIVGSERHWAMSLIPREAMVIRGLTMQQCETTPLPAAHEWRVVSSMQGLMTYGGGPDVRLINKLNDFSLNRYKDYVFEFPEDSRTAAFSLPHTDIFPEPMTAAEFLHTYGRCYVFLAQVGWDYSSEMGPNHWGWSVSHPQAVNYAYNSTKWTAEERLKARSRLVWAAYLMELDMAMPQWCMLGGHPNFAVEYKAVLGVIAGLFPLHPHAPRWRDTYLSFWAEYLDKYVRKADEETGARPGRFTENIACYSYGSMEAICMAATGFKLFDGTQILDRPETRDWFRWDMESRLPFRTDGARVVPPEGAHAGTSLVAPGGRAYNIAYAMACLLKDTAPTLADEWLWTITAGGEGKRPDKLQSTIFADYGPIFRYDFGGPQEAYLQMQQLHGMGYRWSTTSNGALYFAAKGKVWSWNQIEANGDSLDISLLPVLQVGKKSLGDSLADGVLYNFDFAQCYRARALNISGTSPYQSRCVMMVRGDYVAIHDEVQNAGEAKFNWTNQSNGLGFHVYSDTEFQKPLKYFVNDSRFPLMLGEDQLRDFGLPKSPFSIRSEGQFLVPVAGHYKLRTTWNVYLKQNVPAEDTVRIFLDDQKVFDGKGPGATELDLEARTYKIRFEYVHESSDLPYLSFTWEGPDKSVHGQIDNSHYLTGDQMPFIQQVQSGPGDQLHIVAPEKLEVAPAASAAAQVGKAEFVLFGDTAITKPGTSVKFSGRAGYAKEGAVALFEGTEIEMNGLGLSMTGGEFGASVRRASHNSLKGHIAGKSGGQLRIHLPASFSVKGVKATFDGRDVPVTVEESRLLMPVAIKQNDGVKAYTVTAS